MSPQRLKLKRPIPEGAIYVGRSKRFGGGLITDPDPDHFGNPFKEGKDGSREEVVQKFRNLVRADPHLAAKIQIWRGWNVICHCPLDDPCHGDVILEIANP